MTKTIKAKLLLGWMPRCEALHFLLNDCVFDPPMTNEAALQLWEGCRTKVAALPRRVCSTPKVFPLNKREKLAVDKFRKSPRHTTDTIHNIVKIDPRKLVLHQFYVVTERAEEYLKVMHNDKQRIKHCLGLNEQLVETVQNGTVTTIKLPHWEYDLRQGVAPNGQNMLNIIEWPRFISAVDRGDRFLLWGGYHRTYAFLSKMDPEGPAEPPLVTLITHSGVEAFFSATSTRPEVRDSVLSDCPALFEDFFNPDLFIEVSFRKRRREVRLDSATQTMWHGLVDDES
jgi:hypothetical protein